MMFRFGWSGCRFFVLLSHLRGLHQLVLCISGQKIIRPASKLWVWFSLSNWRLFSSSFAVAVISSGFTFPKARLKFEYSFILSLCIQVQFKLVQFSHNVWVSEGVCSYPTIGSEWIPFDPCRLLALGFEKSDVLLSVLYFSLCYNLIYQMTKKIDTEKVTSRKQNTKYPKRKKKKK